MLFRLVDAYEGCVRLGGVDIATMGLQTLRRHLAVIPQVPLLMDGSIRLNLDPFGAHSDRGALLSAVSPEGGHGAKEQPSGARCVRASLW